MKSGYENSVAQKWWEFDISCFGHRAIMNNVTAAMAIEQFKKLPDYMKKRARVHNFYDEHLSKISWIDTPPTLPDDWTTSYYFYHIQVKNGKRDELAKFLREHDIYTTYRYFPLHRVKKYGVSGVFPGADYATDNTLCLPLHQSLSDDDLETVTTKIKEFNDRFC